MSVDTLYLAVQKNDMKALLELLDKDRSNTQKKIEMGTSSGMSYLYLLRLYNSTDYLPMTNLLLQNGASILEKSDKDKEETVLNKITNYNSFDIVLSALKIAGSDQKKIISEMLKPPQTLPDLLDTALYSGNQNQTLIDLIKILVKNGVDINGKDKKGRTILESAITWNQPEVVQFLLNETDANPLVHTSDKHTLLSLATAYNATKIIPLLQAKIEQIKFAPTEAQSLTLKRMGQRNMVIKVGHVLGLSTKVSIKTEEQTVKLINTEGTIRNGDTATWMEDYLTKHIQQLESETVKYQSEQDNISAHFKMLLNSTTNRKHYEIGQKGISESYRKWQQGNNENEILSLAVGLPAHSITISFCDGYVILCNRGNGKINTGLAICKIPDPSKITLEFIEQLTDKVKKHASMESIEKIFLEVGIDFRTGKNLSVKEQQHGTCSFANYKTSLFGILYVLKLNESGNEAAAESYARVQYKKFTHGMRDNCTEELTVDITKANKADDQEMLGFYKQLFNEIIIAHHGQSKNESTVYAGKTNPKRKEETLRAKKLLQYLNDEDINKLFNESFSINQKFTIDKMILYHDLGVSFTKIPNFQDVINVSFLTSHSLDTIIKLLIEEITIARISGNRADLAYYKTLIDNALTNDSSKGTMFHAVSNPHQYGDYLNFKGLFAAFPSDIKKELISKIVNESKYEDELLPTLAPGKIIKLCSALDIPLSEIDDFEKVAKKYLTYDIFSYHEFRNKYSPGLRLLHQDKKSFQALVDLKLTVEADGILQYMCSATPLEDEEQIQYEELKYFAESIPILLQLGGNINHGDDTGETPLMMVIRSGGEDAKEETDQKNLERIKILLNEPSLDLSVRNAEQQTALEVAEALGKEDFVKLIKERLVRDKLAKPPIQFSEGMRTVYKPVKGPKLEDEEGRVSPNRRGSDPKKL